MYRISDHFTTNRPWEFLSLKSTWLAITIVRLSVTWHSKQILLNIYVTDWSFRYKDCLLSITNYYCLSDCILCWKACFKVQIVKYVKAIKMLWHVLSSDNEYITGLTGFFLSPLRDYPLLLCLWNFDYATLYVIGILALQVLAVHEVGIL